ncbi:NADH dehydrogenase [Bacillus thuringiensis serovar yunnanensis]|nr:NADH dehydrogenase [Bacillus thuringiensis serovar yunnanensis]
MLSREARKFLLDMRLFLTAKSVKESDIENFLEDAELHLIEGESEGKSVEDIFGSSPKEYAHELVKVMEKDRRETWKQIGFTVMNIVSFWIIASILIVNNGMLQISLIQCIGYSFSFILVVIGPNFRLRKMAFVTSFTKTWFSMWSLVMIALMFLLGAVTILDVIYPTKMLTFTEVQSYIVAGGIFIITVAINIYFEGWFKNLYLIIPLSIMLVFKTFTTEDLMPMLFQIICLYGSLFILIFVEIMMKTNRREMVK